MGRVRPTVDGPHRGPLPLGREPDVRRDRRPAFQAAGRQPGRSAQRGAGPAGRRIHRRAEGPRRRRGQGALRGSGEGHDPVGRLRPQRPLVALVRAPQDLRRAARRVPPDRQSHGPGGGDQVRRVGRAHPVPAERGADPVDAGDRVRRHERGDGRPLRRHGRQAVADALGSIRASRDHRSPGAGRGHPAGQARQHERAQAARVAGPVRLHRQPDRRPGRDVFLGPGGAASQLRHRRSRPQRVLRRSGQAGRHDRRPDRRDVQRLQHDQDGESALRAGAPDALRGFPRARALQPHPGIDGPGGWRDLLHGAGRAGRVARVSEHDAQLHLLRRIGDGEPRPPRRRHLLRVRRHALGQHLRAFDGDVEIRGGRHRDGDRLPGGRQRFVEVHREIAEALHARVAAPVLGRRRFRGEGERGSREERAGRRKLRRNQADVEIGRHGRSGAAENAATRGAARQSGTRGAHVGAARAGGRSRPCARAGPARRGSRRTAPATAGPRVCCARRAGLGLAQAGGGQARRVSIGWRRPRPRRRVRPVLPAAPARLRGVLGRAHPRGVGPARSRDPGLTGRAAQAGGGDRCLRAAGADADRARLQSARRQRRPRRSSWGATAAEPSTGSRSTCRSIRRTRSCCG